MLGNFMGEAATALSTTKSGGETSSQMSASSQGHGEFLGGMGSVAASASVGITSSVPVEGADNAAGVPSGVNA